MSIEQAAEPGSRLLTIFNIRIVSIPARGKRAELQRGKEIITLEVRVVGERPGVP
jgi:hypothetical protein